MRDINEKGYRSAVYRLRLKGQDIGVPQKHRSSEEWLELIRECRESGQTIAVWCADQGIASSAYTHATWHLRSRGYAVDRQRKSEYIEKWLEVISECTRSGQPAKQWCREHGIIYGTYCHAAWSLRSRGYDIGRKKNGRNKEEWARLIDEQQKSGQPIKIWCAESGVNIRSYYAAVCRLKQKGLIDRQ